MRTGSGVSSTEMAHLDTLRTAAGRLEQSASPRHNPLGSGSMEVVPESSDEDEPDSPATGLLSRHRTVTS